MRDMDMEDLKLEHFLDNGIKKDEPITPNEKPKNKTKSHKSDFAKIPSRKRKRTVTNEDVKEDIPMEDPADQYTFTDIDLSRIKRSDSILNDTSQMNGNTQEYGENTTKNEESFHGKFQKYNKDKQWKLAKIPHHFLPSFNLSNYTDLQNLREYPLLRTSLPHSVYVSSTHLNKVDICHRRTLAYSAYSYRIKALQTAYFTAQKKKKVRKEEKKSVYDKTLVDFIMCRDNHPDKFFERDYDFYYSGGNLCVNNKRSLILHTTGNNLDTINLSLFHLDDTPQLQVIGSASLTETNDKESEVFEINFSRANQDVYFLRRKYSIAMIEYKDDTFTALNTLQSHHIPVISFSEGYAGSNELAITNLQHQIRVYDVKNSAVLQKYKLVSKKDITPATNWNMIRSFDRCVYLYAECKKVSLIDTRIPQAEWQSNYCGFDEENPCSTFCSMATSNFDNLFYMGSNHKLYCVDWRYMGRNIENKNSAVLRWTHQMASCPLMMAVNRCEDSEYIVMQSPQSADLRICENMRCLEKSDADDPAIKKPRTEYPAEYHYEAPCLPYMPETFENIFREARRSGSCIRPDLAISDRIKACNTGLSFIGPRTSPYILTATSNGDVFARHMYNPDDADSFIDQARAVDVMSQYEASISKSVIHPRLAVTEVCDFSGISKVFRCDAFSDTKPEEDLIGVPKRKFLGRWQKSYSRLCKFKDVLVTDLLAIWDIEEPEEKNLNLTDMFQSTDRKSLVSSWLNNTHEIKSSTMINMTSVPFESFNETTLGMDTICETTKINENLEIPETPIVAKPKEKTKKKNRYVKGF